jgi:putative radical SAM enzyme (TIGR03279 family)
MKLGVFETISNGICMKNPGLKIKSIESQSILSETDMRRGDYIVAVNGEEIEDELDFRFFTAEYYLDVVYQRNGVVKTCSITRQEGVPTGVNFYESPINRCRNRCIFCFIDQMPPGLRNGLYIKDEDVKHSFINGNYVTMTGLKQSDLEKTVRLGISPLFVSVHATDQQVRTQMLGVKKAPQVLEQLKFLTEHGIMIHTQIVICPGYNDGEVLKNTILDLFDLGESIRSIAVVPVGITKFRKNPLKMVERENAVEILSVATQISETKKNTDGYRRLFCADELYIKARQKIPSYSHYEDFPQMGNGVGLIRLQLENWRLEKKMIQSGTRKLITKKKVLLLCSVSASTFIRKIVDEIMALSKDLLIDVEAVENDFFGTTVTVAGLLTAKDVLRILKTRNEKYDYACLPSVMFNGAGVTIDGYSLDRIMKNCGMIVRCSEYISDLFTLTKKPQ